MSGICGNSQKTKVKDGSLMLCQYMTYIFMIQYLVFMQLYVKIVC